MADEVAIAGKVEPRKSSKQVKEESAQQIKLEIAEAQLEHDEAKKARAAAEHTCRTASKKIAVLQKRLIELLDK